jgi:NAD(P)-dependent dehydrogenase (short-subunit alcohol dehydrogenase family)
MMTLPALDGFRGVIINSASLAAEDGQEGQSAYAASEGGVLALTRPLARDLVNDGIRVVTIMSGRYDTAMLAERSEDMTQKIQTQEMDKSVLADPDEFAELVLNVIRDDQINGQWVRMKSAQNK